MYTLFESIGSIPNTLFNRCVTTWEFFCFFVMYVHVMYEHELVGTAQNSYEIIELKLKIV